MQRYNIAQTPEGRWVITSARDDQLIWAGSHWLYVDQSDRPLISFPSREGAEHYGERILGGSNE
jgi:hypothetical protein